MSNATKTKVLTILSGVFGRARTVHELPRNPTSAIEKPIQRVCGDIDVFSVEEVTALMRAASDEQDARSTCATRSRARHPCGQSLPTLHPCRQSLAALGVQPTP